MTYLIGRTILVTLKGAAYLIGGLLFGLLPLLVIIVVRGVKWSWKATMWTIGAFSAAALFIIRSI